MEVKISLLIKILSLSFHLILGMVAKWDTTTYWFIKIHESVFFLHILLLAILLRCHDFIFWFPLLLPCAMNIVSNSHPFLPQNWSLPRFYSSKIYILKCSGQTSYNCIIKFEVFHTSCLSVLFHVPFSTHMVAANYWLMTSWGPNPPQSLLTVDIVIVTRMDLPRKLFEHA